MNTNISTSTVTLLVGDPVEDVGERRLLERLIADLDKRSVRAVLFANFTAAGRQQRQVDLLVWTAHRVAQVEVKSLDRQVPVIGPLNGPWQQRMPDGTVRGLEKNAAVQALAATHAVSDVIKKLTRDDEVRSSDPKRDIDTLVCIFPRVPDGSEIDDRDFVTVLGYDELLERLLTPATSQPWNLAAWERLARRLNVYDMSADDPARRAAREDLDDYRLRSVASWEAGARAVELGCILDHSPASNDVLVERLRQNAAVLLHGPSGAGKSATAREIALAASRVDDVAFWVRAAEYRRGRLSDLLRRSTAPFSSTPALTLARTSEDLGVGLIVIVDGVNECAPGDQAALLEQLAAFRLRHPAGLLLTSTIAHDIPLALDASVATLAVPTDDERAAILVSHGATRHDRIPAAFTTPHELSLAAECESALHDDSTVTDLHDGYIRQFAPTVAVRNSLRLVAAYLHDHLRSAAPLLDVTQHLTSATGAGLDPQLVDEVLASRLLDVVAGRVRFRHDLLRDFLVAEAIVHRATDASNLAEYLSQPVNRSLASTALGLSRDVDLVVDTLELLADAELYTSALLGTLGIDVKARVASDATARLAEAAAAIEPGCATFEPEGNSGFGRWHGGRTWAPSTAALLYAAGSALLAEHVGSICELLDRTDILFRAESQAGRGTPTEHVATTYSQSPVREGDLAAAAVLDGVRTRRMHARCGDDSGRVARQFLSEPNAGWGRCYAAALTVGIATADCLPPLVRRARELSTYHVMLETLQAVHDTARLLSAQQKQAICEALDDYQPNNIFLSTSVVEALGALDALPPMPPAETFAESLRDLLANPEQEGAATEAASAWASQFEDASIVGPYYDAIHLLTEHERVQLLMLAGAADSVWLDGTRMRDLVRLAPTRDGELDAQLQQHFRERASIPDRKHHMPQDATEAWLFAIEGLAIFDEELPAPTRPLDDNELAWRGVGNILLHLDLGDAGRHDDWRQLMDAVPAAVADVLCSLQHAQYDHGATKHGRAAAKLVRAYPTEIREVLHWSLEHLGDLTTLGHRHGQWLEMYVVATLGSVGDAISAAKLAAYVAHPELGAAAVDAIRSINNRAVAPK